MGYLCNTVYVGNACIGITESFYDDYFCVIAKCTFHFIEVGRIYDRCSYALCTERMLYKVVSAAVEIICGDDMVAVSRNILQSISNGSGT